MSVSGIEGEDKQGLLLPRERVQINLMYLGSDSKPDAKVFFSAWKNAGYNFWLEFLMKHHWINNKAVILFWNLSCSYNIKQEKT